MASQKYNILYGRLSQEDARAGDSNSIVNQRRILEAYAADQGFDNTIFLADDGYSGTNFERPSWKKIEAMIENDEVETLIVKDLSRLGREYLQVGYLTEIYFPQKGVRFIAINDSVDCRYGKTEYTASVPTSLFRIRIFLDNFFFVLEVTVDDYKHLVRRRRGGVRRKDGGDDEAFSADQHLSLARILFPADGVMRIPVQRIDTAVF